MDLISFAVKAVNTVQRIDRLLSEKPKPKPKQVKAGKKASK